MRLTTLVFRNITRRPARSLLTTSGVAVAVAAVVALVGVARSFEQSLLAFFQQRRVDLVVVRAGGLQSLRSALDETLGREILGLENVEAVSAGLVEVASFEESGLFGVLIRGVAADSFILRDLHMDSGRLFRGDERRTAILGKVLAANLDKRVGDWVEFVPGEPFRVVGVFESPNAMENGVMFVPIRGLQEVMDRPGEVTALTVVAGARDRQALERLAREIARLRPHLEVLPTRDYVESSQETRMARSVAWLISSVALVVGAIGMANTMLTAVYERTREIAALRAMGWRKWSVVRLVLLESVVLSLGGAVLGSGFALGLVGLLSRLPRAAQVVVGTVSPGVVFQGFAVALLVGLVGGAGPAWRAARLLPTEGLRQE